MKKIIEKIITFLILAVMLWAACSYIDITAHNKVPNPEYWEYNAFTIFYERNGK